MCNEEECKELAAKGAYIIIEDSFIENGCPNFVIRRVIKAFKLKGVRYSHWGVLLDQPLSDGSNGVLYDFILGYNDGKHVDVSKLHIDGGEYYKWAPKNKKSHIINTIIDQLRDMRL